MLVTLCEMGEVSMQLTLRKKDLFSAAGLRCRQKLHVLRSPSDGASISINFLSQPFPE